MLLPTMLVVLLLGVVGAYAAIINVIPIRRIIGSSVAVAFVLGLLVYTFIKTRNA